MKKRTTIHLHPNGTGTVEIDGMNITSSVTAVKIEASGPHNGPTLAHLTVVDVEVKAETEEVAVALRDLGAEAVRELPPAQVMRVQPGDVIVFQCETRLSDTQFEDIVTHAKEQFPDNKIAVVDGGIQLRVMRKDGV